MSFHLINLDQIIFDFYDGFSEHNRASGGCNVNPTK